MSTEMEEHTHVSKSCSTTLALRLVSSSPVLKPSKSCEERIDRLSSLWKNDSRDESPIHPSNRHRRKASKLLVVLIVEFIICWTPLYLYHTIGTFDNSTYRFLPGWLLDVFLLLSFLSASCNPITYYFMSHRYRNILSFTWQRIRSRRFRSTLSTRTPNENSIVVQFVIVNQEQHIFLNRLTKSNLI